MKGPLFSLILTLLLAREGFADELVQPADSMADLYDWKARQLFIWKERDDDDPNSSLQTTDQVRIAYEDRLLPAEMHYIAASAYSFSFFEKSDYANLRVICNVDPPRENDYTYRFRCIQALDMPVEKRLEALYDIGEKAFKANPHHIEGSLIYHSIGDYLSLLNRNNEGIRAYKRGFEMIPPEAAEDIAEARGTLAYAYTNPLLSTDMKKQAITYYQEVIAWYKKQTGSYYRSQEIIYTYNMGIAYLFLFQDYAAAIESLLPALQHNAVDVDARVFLAFAYARSGQTKAARELLKTIDISTRFDQARVDFLSCYRDLTLHLLGDGTSLKHCLRLESPQSDVLLHLTDTLSELKIPAADENIWWRMFYRTFKKNLLPDVQNAIASAGSEAELVKERAESGLKDLKLQNLALYQYLVGTLATLTVLLGIAGFLTWKARAIAQRERLRLQNILDSIEEGIFLIHADLSMQAEESAHLKKILGTHYAARLTLSEFFALAGLPADAIALQIACLKAALDEEALAWELNQGNLVTELRLGTRFLALFWQPVFQQHRLRSVCLALRDVTDIQQLKQANAKAQEDADKVLVYVKEVLNGHTQATLRFLNDLPLLFERLHNTIKAEDSNAGLRIAHTIKGSARGLGLTDLREIMHQLETQLQRRDQASIQELFQAAQSISRLYRSAQHFVTEGSHQSSADLFQIISELRTGIEQQLRDAGLSIGEIHVQDSGRLTPFEYEQVREILLHGLTNAIDHGFILPTRKGLNIRVPEIAVVMRADLRNRTLIVRDNGAGLAHDLLKKLAESRDWHPQAGETWSDFLFTDGVTTAEMVTTSSGRGVGLAAVKQATQSLGGHVRLLDNDQGAGTMLEVTWSAR